MEASWRRSEHQVPAPVGDPIHLLVAGDTHGNLDWIGTLSKLAARFGCAGVVQLGDFGFWPDQRIWRSEQHAVINHRWLDAVAERAAHHGVWWRVLDGNHDAHPLARAAFASDDNGVRPIRDGVLDWADRGAVWEWSGVRFGALGGGISIDRSWRCEGRDWWATEVVTDADVDALIERAGPDGVDVLLTHDAPMLPPSVQPLADPVLRADCAASIAHILRAVDAVRPSVVLHGHFHRRYRATLERPWGSVRVEGVASDQEVGDKYGGPWVILELPSLAVG